MNVEPPETLAIIESIVYKSNGFAISSMGFCGRALGANRIQLIFQLSSSRASVQYPDLTEPDNYDM